MSQPAGYCYRDQGTDTSLEKLIQWAKEISNQAGPGVRSEMQVFEGKWKPWSKSLLKDRLEAASNTRHEESESKTYQYGWEWYQERLTVKKQYVQNKQR